MVLSDLKNLEKEQSKFTCKEAIDDIKARKREKWLILQSISKSYPSLPPEYIFSLFPFQSLGS